MNATLATVDTATLAAVAKRLRRNVLEMGRGKGEGYIGQGLGTADIFAVTYFREMAYRADDPSWPDRDRFLLSVGHYSIILFAALAELGVIPRAELATYGGDGSRLEMSACESTPGVEITGGSLGHGLSEAVGMALGLRLQGRSSRVINFLSDGELQEGSTWEAAMAGANFGLSRLMAIVDVNDMQADGAVSSVMRIEPVARKWEAFGWHAEEVDGNSIPAIAAAFDACRRVTDRPQVLVCYTQLGKGVPLIENRAKGHFVRIEPAEWDEAFRQLEASE